MAHWVKCTKCGEKFDADKEPFIRPSKTRQAHEHCPNETQEMKDKYELNMYIKKVLGIDAISIKIQHQIDEYISTYKYTQSGIQKTLEYWYEVKKNTTDKANGGIGIVPYVYEQAYQYQYNIHLAKTANENVTMKQAQINIHVPPQTPQRPVPPHFDF